MCPGQVRGGRRPGYARDGKFTVRQLPGGPPEARQRPDPALGNESLLEALTSP